MIYFSLLTILPLYVVTSVNYQSAERTIKKNAIEYTSSKLQQAINSVDVYIENADGILKSMFFDKNLRQYIYSSQSGHFQRTIALSKVQAILAGYIYPAKYIAQVYIVDNDEQIFASNAVAHDLLEKESWFTDFRDGTDIRTIVPTHDAGNYVSSMGSIDIAITILRKYVNIEKNEPLGVVGIDINYQYISDVFERTGANKDTTNLLITEQGEVVYDNNPNLISKAIDGKMYQQVFQNKTGSYMEDIGNIPYIVVYTTSNETNWKLIQFIPVSELFAEARKIKTDTFIVGLMCILFSMLISIGVSYSVSAPLKKLRREMTKVEKGDMNVHIEITSGDEIGELSNSFNRMIKELSASIKKIYEDEGIKKQIELNMLQQQINPHFLFNTLDSINWMARMQNVPNISSTITS
ncbi:MAG: HAMP domain-containing protein, partial [Vallitaleaceae bacterium]|nr:HAMP domain-containing protein [Vallitaleaceae bacterium]